VEAPVVTIKGVEVADFELRKEEGNMAYPESMMGSIKRLEATREKRIEQKIPFLSLSEKEALLKPGLSGRGKEGNTGRR
jgi:hypothetical protein